MIEYIHIEPDQKVKLLQQENLFTVSTCKETKQIKRSVMMMMIIYDGDMMMWLRGGHNVHRLRISTANCKILLLSKFSNWTCLSASSCASFASNSKCSASATSFATASIRGSSFVAAGAKEAQVLGVSCGFAPVEPPGLMVCGRFEATTDTI